MDSRKELLIVNGENRTDQVASFRYIGGKIDIRYKGQSKTYSYGANKVRRLKLVRTIDPQSVIVKKDGRLVSGVSALYDFGDWIRIDQGDRKYECCPKNEVSLEENTLANQASQDMMDYFRTVADAISLTTDDDVKILSRHFDRISHISSKTVLSKYLTQQGPAENDLLPEHLIFPFGVNLSQKAAVENAFSSQISIIQGPPGTGKTQTILNIIANALMKGKTIAVVSNNNSATANVVEKLEKHGLSFFTAFLGSAANKKAFLAEQDGAYPDMREWVLDSTQKEEVSANKQKLLNELNQMLIGRNRQAEAQQELASLKQERHYFEEYYATFSPDKQVENIVGGLTSHQALELWLQCELAASSGPGPSVWQRVKVLFRHGFRGLHLFNMPLGAVVPALQKQFYSARASELGREIQALTRRLENYRFSDRLEELSDLSMRLLKAELAERYKWQLPRRLFDRTAFGSAQGSFAQEYPVILSTTYSIKSSLSGDFVFDYVLVDEASQVDVVTGVLAFSCARNVVIVGDSKQLPNVVPETTRRITDEIWRRYSFAPHYNYSEHSLLSSAISVWPEAPSVLLREHYRCHPKIAGFCNQKFYDNQLVVLTEDQGEEDVLTLFRTPPGNHARGNLNQRQIDIIKQEIIPRLSGDGSMDIGIIAPYRDQVNALTRQLGRSFEIDTVHKFQGREKESIILSTVDDRISKFVDDPHMLNVAISRAIKRLHVVISRDAGDSRSNLGDLAKYIEYNNYEVIDSAVYSVFDLLYKGYSKKRSALLAKAKRVSEYDSENLMYAVIQGVLAIEEFQSVDCVVHAPLSGLVKDYSQLTPEETAFARNPLTHTDFMLFHKMDKMPLLVVEVDGYKYHQEGTRQAERDAMKDSILSKCGIKIIRLRTNESGEEMRLIRALKGEIGA